MKKYFLFLFVIISLIFAVAVYAELSVGSGFIPGQIWYSKLPLVEGETVNIHTAMWNGGENSVSAKVEFYDKNVILGSREVILLPAELKDVSVPWKITVGDHVISAKIISSTATVSGKSEKIVLDRTKTTDDRQFVSVVIKNEKGNVVSNDTQLQSQIDKTSSEIKNIIPENISKTVADNFNIVDSLRDRTLTEVTTIKNDTQNKISQIENRDKTPIVISPEGVNIRDFTEKPLAYIKLFFFSILVFILGSKILFYGIIILVVFYVIRLVFRKIRNK